MISTSQITWILPMHRSEFVDWYRFGTQRILGCRLVPWGLAEGAPTRIAPSLAGRLAASLPEYTDDFEVLFAVLNPDELLPLYTLSSDGALPVWHDISFQRVQGVIPVSERGAHLLETRLPTGVEIMPPLIAAAVEDVDRRRSRRLAVEGAHAALVIAGLARYGPEFEGRADELAAAAAARDAGQAAAIEGASFLVDVFCYDRHKPYPPGDVGYILDVCAVVDARLKDLDREGVRPTVALAKAARDLAATAPLSLGDLVHRCRPEIELLDAAMQERWSPVASAVFFKLRDELRKQMDLQRSSCSRLVSELAARFQRDAALGCWAAGGFFMFPAFADEYYASLRSSVTAPGKPPAEVTRTDPAPRSAAQPPWPALAPSVEQAALEPATLPGSTREPREGGKGAAEEPTGTEAPSVAPVETAAPPTKTAGRKRGVGQTKRKTGKSAKPAPELPLETATGLPVIGAQQAVEKPPSES